MNRHYLNFDKLSYLLLQTKKRIYHKLKFGRPGRMNILFILGCQRSGTTLLTRIFDNDFNIKVYGEFSELSSQDINKIRMNPLDSVKRKIEADKVPGVVLKPLVETQRARTLLDYFEFSKALWIYRDYKDVAASNIKKFGEKNGIKDLRPIVDDMPGNWRSEGVSDITRETVRHFFSENMAAHDAAALFWLVRNRLFFELELHNNPAVMMCKYDDLVSDPAGVVKSLYRHMSCVYPGDYIIEEVHSDSIGKGQYTKLSSDIDSVCGALLKKLDETYAAKRRFYDVPSLS